MGISTHNRDMQKYQFHGVFFEPMNHRAIVCATLNFKTELSYLTVFLKGDTWKTCDHLSTLCSE